MEISELIGFIISLTAFVILMYRRATSRREQNTQEEIDQDKRLKDFLKSLDIEMNGDEEEPVRLPPPPPPAPKPTPPVTTPQPQALMAFDYKLNNKLEAYKTQSAIATRNLKTSSYYQGNDYHAIQNERPSKSKRILSSLKSSKDMIIINEILTRRYL